MAQDLQSFKYLETKEQKTQEHFRVVKKSFK